MRAFLRFTSAFVLALCAALAVHAEIYQWTDSNGKVHFSDSAPATQAAKAVTLDNINTFSDVSISDAPGWKGFYQPERKPGEALRLSRSTLAHRIIDLVEQAYLRGEVSVTGRAMATRTTARATPVAAGVASPFPAPRP